MADEMLSASQLWGWSRDDRDRWLGEPDQTELMPGGGMMKLYRRDRVEAAEAARDADRVERAERAQPERVEQRAREARVLTADQIRARGWSEAMIRSLLGEPDGWRDPGPYRGAVSRLYDADRVARIEAQPSFADRMAAAARRSAAARAAAAERAARWERERPEREARQAERERQREEERAERERVELEDAAAYAAGAVGWDKLASDAIDHYNAWRITARPRCQYAYNRRLSWSCVWEPATRDNSSVEFLRRIAVNYLRHRRSDYDAKLASITTVTWHRDDYDEWRTRHTDPEALKALQTEVYTAIAKSYPMLADECHRQLADRLNGVTWPFPEYCQRHRPSEEPEVMSA